MLLTRAAAKSLRPLIFHLSYARKDAAALTARESEFSQASTAQIKDFAPISRVVEEEKETSSGATWDAFQTSDFLADKRMLNISEQKRVPRQWFCLSNISLRWALKFILSLVADPDFTRKRKLCCVLHTCLWRAPLILNAHTV